MDRGEAEASLELAERVQDALLEGGDPVPWLDRLEAAYPDLRAALEWFHAEDDVNAELRLAASLGYFWRVRGRLAEGLEVLERALARPLPQAPRLRARALSAAGRLAYRLGDYGRARRLHEESLRTSWSTSGNSWAVGQSLSDLGGVSLAEGDHARAEAFYREAADVLRAAEHHVRLGTVLGNLSVVRLALGDVAGARAYAEEALVLQERTGDSEGRVFTLLGLGRIAAHEGSHREAAALLDDAFALGGELHDREVQAYVVLARAELAWLRGDRGRAVELVHEADEALARVGVVALTADDRAFRERVLGTG